MVKSTCNLALLELHVVNRFRDPYVLYAPNLSNDAMKPY